MDRVATVHDCFPMLLIFHSTLARYLLDLMRAHNTCDHVSEMPLNADSPGWFAFINADLSLHTPTVDTLPLAANGSVRYVDGFHPIYVLSGTRARF